MSAPLLTSGGVVRETGFLGDIISGISTIGDTIGGGPQARAREAAALARAEEARAQVAIATMQQQGGQAVTGGGGIMSHRTLGVPTVALIAGGAVAAYLLMRKRK